MATYMELRSLFGHSDLNDKIEVAVIIAAEIIRTEDGGTVNHANRLVWAKQAFANPVSTANQMIMAMLAANNGLALGSITGASDAAIQASVEAAVDVFADGS